MYTFHISLVLENSCLANESCTLCDITMERLSHIWRHHVWKLFAFEHVLIELYFSKFIFKLWQKNIHYLYHLNIEEKDIQVSCNLIVH